MAESLRIRGQEVQIRITLGGRLQRTITAIENATWTVMMDILRKGYLGETTDRRDDMYKGTKFEFSFDPESKDPFILVRTLRDRAQRRTSQASAQVNATFTCNFPNGERPKVTIPDLKFQDPTLGFANRDSYAGFRFQTEAEDFILSGV